MLATVFTNSVAGAHAFGRIAADFGRVSSRSGDRGGVQSVASCFSQSNKSTNKAYMTRTVRCGAK